MADVSPLHVSYKKNVAIVLRSLDQHEKTEKPHKLGQCPSFVNLNKLNLDIIYSTLKCIKHMQLLYRIYNKRMISFDKRLCRLKNLTYGLSDS